MAGTTLPQHIKTGHVAFEAFHFKRMPQDSTKTFFREARTKMPHQCPQKDLIPSSFSCVCISFAHSHTPGSELIDASLDEPAVRAAAAAAGVLEWERRSRAQYECLLGNSEVGLLAAVNLSSSLSIHRCPLDIRWGPRSRARCGEAAPCSLPAPQRYS